MPINREALTIDSYKVMSLGEAKGWGMVVDDTTLNQLVTLGNAKPVGVKSRVVHPNKTNDGMLAYVGMSSNFRRVGDSVLADLQISKAAFTSPEGNYGAYLLDRSEEEERTQAGTFGASPEVKYQKQAMPGGLPAMRLKVLDAIAFVDDPATNVGFFSTPFKENDMAENADLLKQVGDLSASLESARTENSTLKEQIAKLTADQQAALSAAKDATASAITAERNRAANILALCDKSGHANLSAKFVADGADLTSVQSVLLEAMCSKNKTIGDGGNGGTKETDPDAAYKSEYAAAKDAYLSRGVSEDDYVKSRRIDDGKAFLTAKV